VLLLPLQFLCREALFCSEFLFLPPIGVRVRGRGGLFCREFFLLFLLFFLIGSPFSSSAITFRIRVRIRVRSRVRIRIRIRIRIRVRCDGSSCV